MRERADWGALLCLRIGVLIHRSRGDGTPVALDLQPTPKRFVLSVDRHWLESNPLTDYALSGEVDEWKKIDMALDVSVRDSLKLERIAR